ncbi:MAG: DUF1573 domain-containing protein [Planctomycetaceae bacterium]
MRLFVSFAARLTMLFGGTTALLASPPQRELTWGEKMFSALEHDFGVVTYGSEASHQIAIKNIYKDTITLYGAKSTCGCTSPSLTATSIPSGETAYLVLKLNTTQFKKAKSPNVDVSLSYDGGRTIESVRVAVRAYIRDDVHVSEDLVDFGVVGMTGDRTMKTTINYQGHAPWKITGVKSTEGKLDVQIAEPVRTSRGLNYDVSITIPTGTEPGKIDRQIYLITEEPGARSYIPLHVRATVESDVVVATPVIQLGNLAAGESRSARVILRGRQPFAIESIDGGEACDTAEMDPQVTKKVHIVPITFTAPTVAGRFSETLSIEIYGDHPPVTCKVEGDVTPAVEAAPQAPSLASDAGA